MVLIQNQKSVVYTKFSKVIVPPYKPTEKSVLAFRLLKLVSDTTVVQFVYFPFLTIPPF